MPDSWSSDKILLADMKEGDMQSFNQLFNRYWKKIYTLVFSICGDREVAEAIIHDIFLNLWLKRQKNKIECFEPYILSAARYHVYRHMKNLRRNSLEYHDKLEHSSVATNDGETNLSYQELETKVERHLNVLPRRCKEIFRLSRIQQLSNDEIAERLDISKRTVENQLTHALHHLRISLKFFLMLLIIYSIQNYL